MRLLILYPKLSPTKVPPHYIRRLAEDFPRFGNHTLYGPGRQGYMEGKPIPLVVKELGPFDGVLVLEQKYNGWAVGIRDVELRKGILLTDYVEFKGQVTAANRMLDACEFDVLFYHTWIEGVNLAKSLRRERSVLIPFGVDTSYFVDRGETRTIDACAMWCENKKAYPDRSRIGDMLNHSGLRVFTEHALGDHYVDVLNRSKICVSSGTIYKNMQSRFMEAPACGCMLLTDPVSELSCWGWIPGVHTALYNDPEDCVSKLRYYVTHDEERRRIADAGKKYVLSNFRNELLIKKIEDSFHG